MSDDRLVAGSSIPVRTVYDEESLSQWDPQTQLGHPGRFPFTRGVYERMYRDRLWTMRQYSGFGSARETNARFRYLLDAGQTGLSCAFDLPTQMGLDSDDSRAVGEVGRVGVAIDSLDDMRVLLENIPLDSVSLSMTINATAPLLLLMVELVAIENGVQPSTLRGTVQNDILKEYIARGTYIFPPAPSMRMVADTIEYAKRALPSWHSISISGYHMREAGATAVQEVAFTLANALAYVEEALKRGINIDELAPRLSFFWNSHNDVFVEAAKFRAARRVWARLVNDRWNGNEDAQKMRFHVQTGGSTLTAQQPMNNVARTTLQAAAAVLGGTQSLHTNGYDEALSLPTEDSARLALRTQQIIAYESGLANTVDPLAGSYYVESLTDELDNAIVDEMSRIDEQGGAVRAIEASYMQNEIERSALEYSRSVDEKRTIVVGLNEFVDTETELTTTHQYDENAAQAQLASLQTRRAARDEKQLNESVGAVGEVAKTSENLLPAMRDALTAGATIGEICKALREVFGEY